MDKKTRERALVALSYADYDPLRAAQFYSLAYPPMSQVEYEALAILYAQVTGEVTDHLVGVPPTGHGYHPDYYPRLPTTDLVRLHRMEHESGLDTHAHEMDPFTAGME